MGIVSWSIRPVFVRAGRRRRLGAQLPQRRRGGLALRRLDPAARGDGERRLRRGRSREREPADSDPEFESESESELESEEDEELLEADSLSSSDL
jgi:hypothetical protein